MKEFSIKTTGVGCDPDAGSSEKNGGGFVRVVEPTVSVKNYTAQWFRPEIDLNELALLRFKKGWTLRKIAAHFNMPKTNIVTKIRRLKTSKTET